MITSSPEIPWSDIGSEAARNLLAESDQFSRAVAKALDGVPADKLPDFQGRNWRYEFCIFTMFWFWYVANSPKFVQAGATKPLLDAHHKGCYKAFAEAGLIDAGEDALRHWEDDVEARFLSYKEAYDASLAGVDEDPQLQALNIRGHGTVGWLLVHHLFPGQQPNVPLVMLLNELGSVRFTGLVQMFRELERHYAPTKPWWKFWSN